MRARSIRRARPRNPIQLLAALPLYGKLGLAALLVAELLLAANVGFIERFFTPVAWTAYILFADGAVRALTGRSLMTGRTGEFLLLLPWSVLTWLLFELYNLHLENWEYMGEPLTNLVQRIGYLWAFATITPAVLETADLVKAGLRRHLSVRPVRVSDRALNLSIAVGLAMVIVPVLVPTGVARYLFGSVWLGFIFLLEPLNYKLGGRSLIGDLARGRADRLVSLPLAGVITGLLWEFWNYWATARWEYTLPSVLEIGPNYFEMPILGFIGFIPFMVELWAMYNLLVVLLNRWSPGLIPPAAQDDILRAR